MSSTNKKKQDESAAAKVGMDEQMQADVDAVMRKYDLESNTRIWEGRWRWIIGTVMVLFSLYCIYMTLFFSGLPETRLALFLSLIILIGYLTYPAKRGMVRVNYMPWYDIVLMLLGSASFAYFAFNALPIIRLATRIQLHHVIIGLLGILVLIELCRRCVGVPILFVLGVLLVYTFYNQFSYGASLTQALKTIVYKLFYTTNGVIGTPVNVCYTYIVLFIIFGAFLERTGIASFFLNFANRLAGWASGGPAKVAVVVSAFEGMVSGSSVANTVGSGSVTIPMMKRLGYDADFAAAVEAAASTGGQIMPPIMGAAAFLMAEYIDMPYIQVAVKAILPAVLYFTGVFIAVHLEAKKLGLKGLSKAEMPKWSYLAKQCYLLLPLILLVWLVSSNTRTLQFSAAVCIVAAMAVGFINKYERLTFLGIFEALEAGAKGAITVAVACGIAGMVAGCITVTGLASTLINAIVNIAGNAKIVGLVLTMICCIVLGMGVPTTANYCIMASTCAPILVKLGFPLIASHFFVFYFGIVADITPPVALAAYAGAAISKGNPMRTGLLATKLAVAAFVVPYIFAYSPAMLLVDVHSFWEIIQIVLTALLGIFGVAAGLEGFVLRKMNWLLRIVCIGGGLALMIPGAASDLVGLVLIGGVFALQYLQNKKEASAA